MIFGCISFSPNVIPFSVEDDHKMISKGIDHLVLHKVSLQGFTGGFFLHSSLPYNTTDMYFRDEEHDTVVLLSGTLFNKTELYKRAGLAVTVTGPELISRLFVKEGAACVNELNGDFAVFIFQPAKKQAFLFRDHVGIRPIAYRIENQSLFFSSDPIGLCRAFTGDRAFDSDFLMGYFKYIDYRKTSCERVKKLLPGHYLRFSEKGAEIRKYWKPENIRTDKKLSHDQMLADLKVLLYDAVSIRCDNRFRAGTHVSSGLDSGIISVLSRREYSHQETFSGFSWSPASYVPVDVKYDERELVRKLCRETGISPLFSDLDGDIFPGIVSSFYDNHGFFSEDRTVRQAADVGVNLIFSGWGGDEFVSTAAPSIETDLLRSMKLGLYLRRNQVRHPRKFIKNVVCYVLMPALGILERGTVRSFRDDARYLKKPYWKSDRRAVRQFYFHTSRRGHHLGMLNFYHLQDRCENWFMMGYRNGVEYRYPLLDKRIIEFMLRVPSELLCKTDYFRPLLREISEGMLPEEIRLSKSKNDPVYWEWMYGLFREAAVRFMEEVDVWERNPDLHFVDFDLLNEDIGKYKNLPDSVNGKVLFRALVYIKAIHMFMIAYRK
jgi:asparagine synthase (glutamine-hydrolysing)